MNITAKELQVLLQVEARLEAGVDIEVIRDEYLVNNCRIYI